MSKKLLLGSLSILLMVLGYMLWDPTEYSPGYSESAFMAVIYDMNEAEVRRLLGEPLGVHAGRPGVIRWYAPPGSWIGEDSGLHCPCSDVSICCIIRATRDV